jgi:acetyl-CoA acetyltransferase
MSEYSHFSIPAASQALSRKAAIIGVGETDFHLDYKASRAKAPGYEPPTLEGLATTAFERALTDSGLSRQDIDGVAVSFLHGGPSPRQTAELLGLEPKYAVQNGGIMAGPLQNMVAAIASGECETVAMIYAVASRSKGRVHGGTTFDGGGAPTSYYYYHPWGWSSQAAHWALVWRAYQAEFGKTEADLGSVAVQLRQHAMANPNATMQSPLSIEDYLASRYVVRPLHLFDLCLVNDGAVCLILRRADKARDLQHAPVLVAGWGDSRVKADKFQVMVRERLANQMREAADQTFAMAGLTRDDVQHFEAYDASTMHLINQVEGFGFAAQGAGLDFCKRGGLALDGRLPTNTEGGMLSGSYMHGWNHVAEITRQLRHEAGPRQVKGVQTSLFSLAQTDMVHPILFTRGA